MTPVVRTDRLRLGLRSVLASELTPARVSWGRGSVPRASAAAPMSGTDPQGWASLQVLSGPSPHRWGRARGEVIYAISSATVEVAELAAEDDSAFITANLQRFRYDLATGEDAEDARDALLAMIDTALGPFGVVAVASGDRAIAFSGATPGDLYQVSAQGSASRPAQTFDSATPLEFASGPMVSRVELQTFSKVPETGAAELMAQAQVALLSNIVSERLWSLYGVSLADRGQLPTDLSALAEGYWESRSAWVFSCYQLGAVARPCDVIESVALRFGLSDEIVFTLTGSLLAPP